jgi:transposase-like protein
VRRGRDFWKQLVDEVERGERIVDVARRHRVQPGTLSWWRWKLRSDGAIDGRFLPVVVARAEQRVGGETIELRVRDVAVRFGSDTDVAYIAALVHALRA